MNDKIKNLFKLLSKYTTIMLVPHTSQRTIKISISIAFLLFTIMIWTGSVIWISYLCARHVNYLKNQFSYKIAKDKLFFSVDKVKKYQEFLEQVQAKDKKLRIILGMKISGEDKTSGILGGPTIENEIYLQKMLGKRVHEFSIEDLRCQIKYFQQEINSRLDSIKKIDENIVYQRTLYRAIPNILPCRGNVNTNYGYRVHPITGEYEFHKGIDISGSLKTPILATADGIVKESGWFPGYGNLIVIDHEFGYQTRYGHLSKILVSQNEKVTRGKIIGLMGDTGTATCVHLHYEVRYNGSTLNPVDFLDKDVYFSRK